MLFCYYHSSSSSLQFTFLLIASTMFGPIQVFQRRVDGSVDFYRSWLDYKNGFGVLSGEFWLGNENIHALTSSGENVLRIDLKDFEGETRYAAYTGFSIDNETTYYTLRLWGMVPSSDAGECVRVVLYEITRQYTRATHCSLSRTKTI